MIPVAPQNYLFVEIEKKYVDEIVTESGLKLYQDTSFRPEFHVTITGRVVSIPKKLNNLSKEGLMDHGIKRTEIIPEVKAGDEVMFSYLTVFDVEHLDDREEVFTEDESNSPWITLYSNKKGENLIVEYRVDDRWDILATNKEGLVVNELRKGTDREKEAWMANYKFSKHTELKYLNVVEVGDKTFWRVDYAHVIAAKREEKWMPIGGNVILEPPIKQSLERSGIVLLNPVKASSEDRARVIAVGSPMRHRPRLGITQGDTVVFDSRFAEKYTVQGKDVLVLKQDRVLAKQN